MNIFGALTIGIFVASAVVAARLAITLLPAFQPNIRGGAVILLALLSGFSVTKLYLKFLDRMADAHDPAKRKDTKPPRPSESTENVNDQKKNL